MGQLASTRRVELPKTMRAAAYAKHGGPDVLYIDEGMPTPKLKSGEVMVKVHATCVNPVDVKLRAYSVPNFIIPLPKIPGSDFCGEIIDLDSSVRGFTKGDRVFGMMPLNFFSAGSTTEYVAISASLIAKAPKNLIHFSDCASLPLVALTVLQATKAFEQHHHGNTSGKRVLIQAASGGVGSLAAQYCKNVLQMEVFGTCSSQNADFVRACGVDHIIDYYTTKFTDVVHLADLVIDPKSYMYQDETLKGDVLKKGGFYVNIASSENKHDESYRDLLGLAIPEASIKSMWNYTTHTWYHNTRFYLGYPEIHYEVVFVKPDGAGLHRISQLVDEDKIRPTVEATFPLHEIAYAHDKVEQGHALGKIVILVADTEDEEETKQTLFS